MKILFIHQNFPAQFRHLAPALQRMGHDVKALTVKGGSLPGIDTLRHDARMKTFTGGHPWTAEFNNKVASGTSALQTMLQLQASGWRPDLVVAHPAWGEAMFVKDLWPSCLLLCYLEFYYRWTGQDVGFDPEFVHGDLNAQARLRLKNLTHLLALEAMDMGLTPTHWQRSSFPAPWSDRLRVIFDGVDTKRAHPNPQAQLTLQDAHGAQRTVKAGDEVLTFVARNLEPYRGYHQFMRALPEIQRQRPRAVTLIVGGDSTSYGPRPVGAPSWKAQYLNEVRDRLDVGRVFFLGQLTYEHYLRVLQVSACHVYLTYPFVLSWSCMEAMSAGCMVVGSRTPPVEEVVEDGVNGLLCDFFDPNELAAKVCRVLGNPEAYRAMRDQARRKMVDQYDLRQVCLPQQLALIQELAGAPAPPNTSLTPKKSRQGEKQPAGD